MIDNQQQRQRLNKKKKKLKNQNLITITIIYKLLILLVQRLVALGFGYYMHALEDMIYFLTIKRLDFYYLNYLFA